MKYSSKNITRVFIINVWILVVLGLFALASASMILAKTQFNDPYYYLKQQFIKGVLIGIVFFIIAYLLPLNFYKKTAPFFFVASLILVILLFTPLGMELNNARRWLHIGPIVFQPNELLKLAFILYLSLWLSKKSSKEKNSFATIFAFLFYLIIIGFPMFLEPATSSLIILLAASCIVFFASGIKMRYMLITILVTCLILGLAYIALKHLNPQDYRLQRIVQYLNFHKSGGQVNAQDKNYQLNQAVMAIGSGGLKGVGFGQGVIKYNNYLPEPMGDSIFAIIAQEFGFIGSIILVILYLNLFLHGIKISINASDEFCKLASLGIVSLMMIQMIIHIAAISGIFILTGQPLPLISYGSTNLVILLTSLGIVANISKYS